MVADSAGGAIPEQLDTAFMGNHAQIGGGLRGGDGVGLGAEGAAAQGGKKQSLEKRKAHGLGTGCRGAVYTAG
jgi:hypothetical protein